MVEQEQPHDTGTRGRPTVLTAAHPPPTHLLVAGVEPSAPTETMRTDEMSNAIATLYRGIEFRSRLEARWAAFFTEIGWAYTYEPFDGDGYIPDFLIHGDKPFLVEVKPAATVDEYREPIAKVERGLRSHWTRDILIVGVTPTARLDGELSPGLLGEAWTEQLDAPCEWIWDPAAWIICGLCDATAIHHTVQSYAGRPCSHYDGDHYIWPLPEQPLAAAWAIATNNVKWLGRAA